MKYSFYSQIEYREFIRKIPEGIKFETKSEPFEMPIILLVHTDNNLYFYDSKKR